MKTKKLIFKIMILGLAIAAVSPVWPARAAQVTSRSITLGSAAAGAVTTHKFSFTIPTSGNVGSVSFQYCTTAYASCVTPTNLVTTSATLVAQTGQTGFSIVNGVNGTPYLSRSAVNVTGPAAVSYTLGNITNPTPSNTEFWVRIKTYASTDTTGSSTDDGVVAFDTANEIVVSGTMPESLVFCVGTSGTDCASITGSAVNLGTFSPTGTSTGTSVMSASTNAGFGYAITINGTTMTSGSNTIPAMGTQTLNSTACSPGCASATGTSQFGTNVRSNSTPSVGANVTGTGTAVGSGGYNTPNSFRFFNGDTVASSSGVTQANLFTNSYIVNVGGDQAAGVYSSTLTYICTATF